MAIAGLVIDRNIGLGLPLTRQANFFSPRCVALRIAFTDGDHGRLGVAA
jgi:hypothetical protein